jgi:hypothetical protein
MNSTDFGRFVAREGGFGRVDACSREITTRILERASDLISRLATCGERIR